MHAILTLVLLTISNVPVEVMVFIFYSDEVIGVGEGIT
jgi:hypothetical protein